MFTIYGVAIVAIAAITVGFIVWVMRPRRLHAVVSSSRMKSEFSIEAGEPEMDKNDPDSNLDTGLVRLKPDLYQSPDLLI